FSSLSLLSLVSICSLMSVCAIFSALSVFSICSVVSFFSICSVVSVFTICSVVSIFAICSVVSVFAIFTVVSVFAIFTVVSVFAIFTVVSVFAIAWFLFYFIHNYSTSDCHLIPSLIYYCIRYFIFPWLFCVDLTRNLNIIRYITINVIFCSCTRLLIRFSNFKFHWIITI